jgi:hypothetical protein
LEDIRKKNLNKIYKNLISYKNMTSTSHKSISQRVDKIMQMVKELEALLGNPADEVEKNIKQLANIK